MQMSLLVLNIFLDDAVIQTGGLALNILPESFLNLREDIHIPEISILARDVAFVLPLRRSNCCANPLPFIGKVQKLLYY